jgi:hypothetical protein
MEWYWYITGVFTILFIQSAILNIALMNGWVKIYRNKRKLTVVHGYELENSRQLKSAQ